MRKESSTVQKCKRQMATLGFDSQLAYHRVKLILKIYRDVVWVLSERVEELREYAWELGAQDADIILLEQLRTIDKSRLRDKLGSLGEDQMCKLDHALEVSVGLLPIYNTI